MDEPFINGNTKQRHVLDRERNARENMGLPLHRMAREGPYGDTAQPQHNDGAILHFQMGLASFNLAMLLNAPQMDQQSVTLRPQCFAKNSSISTCAKLGSRWPL